GSLYFQTIAGDSELFVADLRTYRDSNRAPDDEHKSMLGSEQRAALERWLSQSRARFKIFGSSVTFAHRPAGNSDTWNSFDRERRALTRVAAEHDARGLLLVSGDLHWNALFQYREPFQDRVFRFYELMATPFAAPRRSVPDEPDPELLARDD